MLSEIIQLQSDEKSEKKLSDPRNPVSCYSFTAACRRADLTADG